MKTEGDRATHQHENRLTPHEVGLDDTAVEDCAPANSGICPWCGRPYTPENLWGKHGDCVDKSIFVCITAPMFLKMIKVLKTEGRKKQ